jgi:hypothetical protein
MADQQPTTEAWFLKLIYEGWFKRRGSLDLAGTRITFFDMLREGTSSHARTGQSME